MTDTTQKARSRLFLPLAALGLLTALLVLGVAWLAGTTSGSRWLLARTPLPETVSFELADGSLFHGLQFSDLSIRSETFVFSAERGMLTVRPIGFASGLTLQNVMLENTTLRLLNNVSDASTPTRPLDPAGWSAPLPVVLEAGEIRGLTVMSDAGESILLEQILLAGRWDQALSGLRLQVQSAWLNVDASGELRLADGRTELQLDAQLDAQRFDPVLPADLVIQATTDAGLNDIALVLSSDIDGLRATGSLANLLESPQLALEINLERLDLPTDDDPALTLVGIEGSVNWSMQDYRLALTGGMNTTAIEDLPEPIAWEMTVNGEPAGDSTAVILEKLNLALGEGRLQATGVVRLGESAGEPPLLDLNLDWQSLQWPVSGSAPDVTSSEGSGHLTGHPADWVFEGQFALATPDYPGGRLSTLARGDMSGARFETLEGSLLGGTLAGQGSVVWDDTARAEWVLNFSTLDLASVLPEWPALVSGEASGSLSWQDELEVRVEVPQLDGRLFDESLSLAGGLIWDARGFELSEIRLAAGTSYIEADGFFGQQWHADLELDIRGPGWLARRAGGNWVGHMALDSRQDFPVLTADLLGESVALGDLSFRQLTLRLAEPDSASLSLEATDIKLNDSLIDTFSLQLAADASGEPTGDSGEAQRLTVSARQADWTLTASSHGNLSKSRSFAQTAWRGTLDAARLRQGEEPFLDLQSESPLELGADRVALRDACFELQTGGALCLSLEQAQDTGLDIAGEFRALSLALLGKFSLDGLASTQVLDGPFRWSSQSATGPEGSADLRLSAGDIYDPNADEFDIEVGAGALGFTLSDGTLRNGRLDLLLPGAGYIRSTFEIDGVRLDGTGQLRGNLEIALENLHIVDEFIDTVQDLTGTLRLSMALSGVTADPKFNGGFDLSGVSFSVPLLGTEISDLSFRGRVDNADRLTLRGPFQVGEGRGTLSLNARLRDWDDPSLDIRLLGENLALARLPDLSLDLSPDIRLAYQDEGWQVSGTAQIPQATISPLTIGVERIDESPDVVVVAGEQVDVGERDSRPPATISGGIAVTLGDNVRVLMDKADLGLTGAVQMQWGADPIPTAQGEILVNGDVTAWGPRLKINDGRVRWSGDSVTNPLLEVRAERDVFGNTPVRTAGVRVAGSAQNLDIEAYTSPLTTSERAWAILLTGSDVNFAQGVGAFDVGAYIAPRIFLSYGISFFDSDNVVGIRYDLRRGWGIKATSGQQDSGIDLSYTIEN